MVAKLDLRWSKPVRNAVDGLVCGVLTHETKADGADLFADQSRHCYVLTDWYTK